MWPAVMARLHSVSDQPDAPAVHAQFDRLIDYVSEQIPSRGGAPRGRTRRHSGVHRVHRVPREDVRTHTTPLHRSRHDARLDRLTITGHAALHPPGDLTCGWNAVFDFPVYERWNEDGGASGPFSETRACGPALWWLGWFLLMLTPSMGQLVAAACAQTFALMSRSARAIERGGLPPVLVPCGSRRLVLRRTT